jgi:regulator of sigma E protease
MQTAFLIKVVAVVGLLGALVFVHELGHFIVAKLLGVKVLRFSIGFGPRLFGVRRGETEYWISALPLGGYVKMLGADPNETLSAADRGRAVLAQPPWRRFLIFAAGPGMNLAFPIVIYFAMSLAQNGSLVPSARVGALAPDSPAAEAGLRPGDHFLAVTPPGGPRQPVRYFGDLRELVGPHPGQPLVFEVERNGKVLPPLTITPASERETNELETVERGVLGVTASYSPAVVAPVRAGAAGPLQPFDLVVAVGDRKIARASDLQDAIDAARCGPVDLQVLREQPVPMPGATLSTYASLKLAAVPTCAGGAPTFASAAPIASTFIAAVEQGSPAEQAGLRRGDAIAAVNGRPVHSFRDINLILADMKPGDPVRLDLALTDGRKVTLAPAEKEQRNELGGKARKRVSLGFFPDQRDLFADDALLVERVPLQIGVWEAAGNALGAVKEAIRSTVLGIVKIATGKLGLDNLGGPIMLFTLAAKAAERGLSVYLTIMAAISVNLGLMNLLPIPVLDGGHIVTAVLESVTRRPLSLRAREVANLVGIVLLVLLMVVAFKNDIVRVLQIG